MPITTWAIVHSPLGLLGILPLELRDKIYEYITEDISTLTIPPDFSNSLPVFIARRLPPCLLLNHQIFNEAAAAYHRRTLLIVTSASVPSPKSLLLEIATSTTFKNLRTLKFTQPQDCYARSSDLASQVAVAECVHAVVEHCPILRDLTMTISADMLFTLSKDLPPRVRTMQEVEEKMQFSQLLEQKFIRKFEHDGLLNLQLICNDAAKYSRGIWKDHGNLFERFVQTFLEEAKKKKHRMVFNVKLCPGAPGTYNEKNPELIWNKRGNITSYHYMDFFG